MSSSQLVCGVALGGSPAYDVGLDVVAPPSPISPIQLDAYLPTTNDYVTRLLSDFRDETESMTFRFKVRADVDNFSLSWDLSDLPSTFTLVQLRQVAPVSDLIIDMEAESEAIFSALPPSELYLNC